MGITYSYLQAYSASQYYFFAFINANSQSDIDLEMKIVKGTPGTNKKLIQPEETEVIYTLLVVTGGGLALWIFLLCVKTVCTKPVPQNQNTRNRQQEDVSEEEYLELVNKAMPSIAYSHIDSVKFTKATRYLFLS